MYYTVVFAVFLKYTFFSYAALCLNVKAPRKQGCFCALGHTYYMLLLGWTENISLV